MAHVDNSPERIAENDKIVYRVSEKLTEDEFSKDIQAAIQEIENQFRPKITQSSMLRNLYSRLARGVGFLEF